MMKPAPEPAEEAAHGDVAGEHGAPDSHAKPGHAPASHAAAGHGEEGGEGPVYVAFERPFFAPITRVGGHRALVRLDLHLEVPSVMEETVIAHEPKLRDGFLRSVLAFSQAGGFSTMGEGDGFDQLRDELLTSARAVLGPKVQNVLIGEILSRT